MKKSRLWGAVAIYSISLPSHAALINFEYVGATLSGYDVNTPQSLKDEFLPGTPVTVRYTFDSDTVDTQNGNIDLGIYQDAVSSITYTLGSYSATSTAGNIVVGNPFSGVVDRYAVNNTPISPVTTAGGHIWNSAYITMDDYTQTAFDTDALPLLPPDPIDFGYSIHANFNFLVGGVNARFTQVTATVVPIPPALSLFGSGLLGLVGMARRKKAV